jgi:ribose 5-phosphate isomerase B
MKIALGSDHRGFQTKERLRSFLADSGHEVIDCGTSGETSSDYPDYAVPPCELVAKGKADRAILMCGSGIGMAIVANKVAGIRAALCHDELTAEMSRRHNDANVLCLAADLLGDELIHRMVDVWVTTPFDGGRHARRVQKMMAAEKFLAAGGEYVPTACSATAKNKPTKAK